MKQLLLLVLVASIFQSYACIHRKNLAGPPEEFELHAQPHPMEAASTSLSTVLAVEFVNTLQGNYIWESPIFVDSSVYFGFTVYSPADVKATLVDPDLKVVDLEGLAVHEMTPIIGSETVPTTTYIITKPTPGMYWLHLESASESVHAQRDSRVTETPDAYVIVKNESPLELISYANTFDLAVGTDIGLMAQISDGSQGPSMEPVKGVLALAKLAVTFPDGHKEVVPMRDDGLKGDQVEDDGIFVGVVPSTEAGYYTVQASVSGFDANGREFTRTTDHVFAVSSILSDLSGSATIETISSESIMQINVGVTASSANSVRFYGELYGTNENNEEEAICWIGGLNDITTDAHPTIIMQVDLDWLVRAGVKPEGPFKLKNAFVQDVANWAIVSSASEISLTYVSDAVMAQVTEYVSAPRTYEFDEITERMREGVRPKEFPRNRAPSYNDTATPLVLIHGYCSPVNPWEASAADFTNPKFFLNAKASLGHDDYAKVLLDWANSLGPFSSIGHSQGGIVLAHTKNYYWSGLDQHQTAGSGRLIQSVASPFQGNSAAGTTANLGKMFGVGCGANTDLTVTGSTLWLSGITAESRAKVFVYTATYKQSAFIDYCNLAMNLVIKTYNDGIAELVYTPLPGANAQGNDEPWCHSDGMKYPAVFLDSKRNVQMNELAQR